MPYRGSKIVFSRFMLTIYYMGIRGVIRGYRGLHGGTGVSMGLQGVTWAYKRLQEVTRG